MAKEFLALHHNTQTLLLAGAWDVVSAKIFESGGFKAIGTTSAGISASLGFADGERMTIEDNLAVVKRIVNNCNLPVSADIEAGYADSIEDISENTKLVIDAGVVGLNIEDSTGNINQPLYAVEYQSEKIQNIRKVANEMGISLVINARTDAFMLATSDPDKGISNTISRAKAYLASGADCIFIPDVQGVEKSAIIRLVENIDAPVNFLLGPEMPDITEMQNLGVARVSLGPRPMRAILSKLQTVVNELVNEGTSNSMTSSISYNDINAWFSR